MALFDFLKKKEIDEIDRLRKEVEDNKRNYEREIENLNRQLFRFNSIVDLESEIELKRQELIQIIENNKIEKENYEADLNKITSESQMALKREVENKDKELKQIIENNTDEISKQRANIKALSTDYQVALEIYKGLRREINVFESKLDLIEFGIYEPIYDFEKSDDYREEQNRIIEQQKSMILSDKAAICTINWTVDGSEVKGKSVVRVYKKLMLRAFNGESDVLIAKVKWNSINQMKERMQKVFSAINKLGEGFKVYLNMEYLFLKEKELILEYEYQAKKQKEKEKIRAIQDELKEEEKARRDFEKAQKEAEKEEAYYQKAIEKVYKEVERSKGGETEKLHNQIAQLEQELINVQKRKERALSMAQQTKRGHVYIISNIGAFGENVYKIGMTRRLEPDDRVKELGDASVPFQFDIHAMIYSDEARTLEYELHKAFSDRKVNMLNYRKEFFRVTLDEIEDTIKRLGFNAEFTRIPEAMQYRETLAILEKLNNKEKARTIDEIIAEEFPQSLTMYDDE